MNDVKRYLRNIRSVFPIYSSYEKRFYEDLKNSIEEYTYNAKINSFSDLENEFGSPTKIICDYLSSVDADYLSKQLSRIKYLRIICISIVVVCIISLSILVTIW